MKSLKQLLFVTTIAVPCIWIIMSFCPFHFPALHDNALIPRLFQPPPKPAMIVHVKAVQQYVKTLLNSSLQVKNAPMTDPPVINAVKAFVFFIGSARSGHSIVATLMDAHPHVIIPHEYHMFKNWQQFQYPSNQKWTETLFNLLYDKSSKDASGIRNISSKGYSLKVDNLWQGKVDDYIEVIGDKCAESVGREYLKNKTLFQVRLKLLQNKLAIPVHVIHVIRNPFDQIVTRSFYLVCGNGSLTVGLDVSKLKQALKEGLPDSKFKREDIAAKAAQQLFTFHNASMELTKLLEARNVLEVHISDFISDPRATLRRIFEFLEVDTSEHYLELCAGKVFKSTSQTRELMFWPPSLKHVVEEKIRSYEFLSRYNFTND